MTIFIEVLMWLLVAEIFLLIVYGFISITDEFSMQGYSYTSLYLLINVCFTQLELYMMLFIEWDI